MISSACGILCAHVARLAKADHVVPRICKVRCGEHAEWDDVMDRKAVANVFAAVRTIAALLADNGSAGNKPSPAAIRSWPADPIRSRCAFRLGRPSASNGTKLRHSVLCGEPRLLPELASAMGARQGKAGFPAVVCFAPDIFWPKCISGSLPGAEFVADQVGLWRGIQKRIGLPARSTRRTAKARFCRPVRLHRKRGLACFAGLFDHADSIPKRLNMGKRTTLSALIPEARPQPIQEGFDL